MFLRPGKKTGTKSLEFVLNTFTALSFSHLGLWVFPQLWSLTKENWRHMLSQHVGIGNEFVLVGTRYRRSCFGPSPIETNMSNFHAPSLESREAGPPKVQIAAWDRFQPPDGSDIDSLGAKKW